MPVTYPRYFVLTCRVCWVAEVTGTNPAEGWAGGGSGGGVCGLAAVVVEPPQDGDVAALRGYSFLRKREIKLTFIKNTNIFNIYFQYLYSC